MPKWVARLNHGRIDVDVEDERKGKVVLDACFFPHRTASPGASPLRRRTERDVRKDSCGKGNIVFMECDALHVPYAIVSFKTDRLWMVRISLQVLCYSCGRSIPADQGCSLSGSGQLRFMREQFIYAGCLMTAGTELWEAHECNKPGQLRKNHSVYKKGNNPKGKIVETAAIVQGAMIERWEYAD